MLYKVEAGKIKILDLRNDKVNSLPFTLQVNILKVSLNQTKDKIAVLGKTDLTDSTLFIFDLSNGQKLLELNIFYDFQWYDSSTILFSDGKSIYRQNLTEKQPEKLFNFSRYKIAPVSLTISPDMKRIAFTKWKGDRKVLCIFDLANPAIKQFKFSVYEYTWFTNEQLIYNLGNGLKSINIYAEKSKIMLKDIDDLINKIGLNYEELIDLSQVMHKSEVIVNEISEPKFLGDKLYFKFFLATEKEKRIGIASIKINFSDLKFHFYEKAGLIDTYYLIDGSEIIGVYLTPNSLIGEKFSAGLQYFQNKEKVDLIDFKPFWNLNIPT